MKGIPKNINTGQDLVNCLALHKAGEISTEEMQDIIRQIENRRFIRCPIISVSDDRKTITIRYCAEAVAGQLANDITISGVEHTNGDDDMPVATVITLKKPLPETEVLLLPAPTDPFEILGMTQTQLDDIKEALS